MFELYLTEHLFGSMISITKEQMFALGMVSIMTKTMSNIFMELGILIIFVIAGLMYFMSSKPVSQVYYQPLRIQSGDTLWKIASQYAPEHKDIREVVYEIQSYNHLVDAGALRPGMVIHIPVEASSINDEINIAAK